MVRACLCVGRTKYASKPEKWHSEGKLCDRINKGVGLRATLPIYGNSQCMGGAPWPGMLGNSTLAKVRDRGECEWPQRLAQVAHRGALHGVQ